MHSRASEDLHYCFASLDIEPIRKRFPDWPDPFSAHEVFSCHNVPDVGAAFVALIREVMLIRPMRVPALRLSLDALVLSIVRSTLDRSVNKNAVGWHRGVEAAVELVRRNPGDHWNLRKLSRMAGLSEGHLTHLFRTQIGQSPHRFIMTTRLERAREQLTHSDLSITQIALELGFSSSQHLSTSFRNHFQISPRELKHSLENPNFCLAS
jgi:transcriptional regulator GlxA family with amidase domain